MSDIPHPVTLMLTAIGGEETVVMTQFIFECQDCQLKACALCRHTTKMSLKK